MAEGLGSIVTSNHLEPSKAENVAASAVHQEWMMAVTLRNKPTTQTPMSVSNISLTNFYRYFSKSCVILQRGITQPIPRLFLTYL